MTAAADLEALWYDHRAPLLRYVCQRVDPVLAEDLVQEVYLSAFDAMERGVGYQDHAKGWIYRIAHNRLIDLYRHRERYPVVDLEVLIELPTRENAHDTALRNIDSEQLQRAIAKLSSDQAQVLTMRFLEGREYDEIAIELSKTIGAVKALQHRALTKMSELLGNATPRRRLPGCQGIVYELISQQGPMTVPEIVGKTGESKNSVSNALAVHPEMFVRIGLRQGKTKLINVWGIVGVHDREAA